MKNKQFLPLGLASIILVGCGQFSPTSARPEAPFAPMADNPAIAQSSPAMIRSGSFVAGEHPTQGRVRIVKQNNKTMLELDSTFKSDQGPDLVMALHRSSDVIGASKPPTFALKEGDYVVIAPLKKVTGAQTYVIPDKINLKDYNSVVIWCRQFNATFGAAKLSHQ